MIGQLSGILGDKNPPQVVVDCNGVGYEVQVPMSTFYNLPALGAKVKLLTHFVVREDAQILYGFETPAEREAFRQLIKISGVGPRTALSVLSGMSVTELAQAITLQEVGRLEKVPGYGPNTRTIMQIRVANTAPANAYDLAGVKLVGGKMVSLKQGWTGDPATRSFLHSLRRRSCLVFNMVLSPDYNADHADHLHFDMGHWRSCS